VNTPTAVARRSGGTTSPATLAPAFHTSTYASPPSTRDARSDANAPVTAAYQPHAPAASTATPAAVTARRVATRSSSTPTGTLATTAVAYITLTSDAAAAGPTSSDWRTSGITLAGAIS